MQEPSRHFGTFRLVALAMRAMIAGVRSAVLLGLRDLGVECGRLRMIRVHWTGLGSGFVSQQYGTHRIAIDGDVVRVDAADDGQAQRGMDIVVQSSGSIVEMRCGVLRSTNEVFAADARDYEQGFP